MTSTDAGHALVAQQLDAGIAAWARFAEQMAQPELRGAVEAAGQVVLDALRGGHTLLVAGNGGSASVAGHVATEFLGKCILDRRPLPAISLAESSSTLTAVGNDYGFDQVFVRGVKAHGQPGDVLLAMSTSGTSPNVIAALAEARSRGLTTIFMVGMKGAGQGHLTDHLLVVPSAETPRIQEVHLLWSHAWCEAIDLAMQEHS